MSEHQHASAPAAGRVIDPVCGMTVDPQATPHQHTHHGKPYFFCSGGCRTKFAAEPEKFLGAKAEPEPMPEDTVYTCPMHPGGPPDRAGELPDLRHGARAGRGDRR